MSFLAKLYLQGNTYNVLDSNIHFYQQCDPRTNKPEALPNGGLFQISIEATALTDLLHLVTAPDQMCEGHIRFFKRDGLSKLTDYEFFDTYIVRYQRTYEAFSGTPATDTLVFSPGILRIGDMVFEKPWKVTDLARRQAPQGPSNAPLPQEQPKAPNLVDYYLTDTLNNRIEKAKPGDTVFLNIKTKDLLGKTLTINLNDHTVDFMYQGKRLENDTLKDIAIAKDFLQIELEAVAPESSDENKTKA